MLLKIFMQTINLNPIPNLVNRAMAKPESPEPTVA